MKPDRIWPLLPLISLLVVGCTDLETNGSKTIPLKEALAGVETEVRDTYPVALSDIATGNDVTIRAALIKAQCYDKSAEPLIPVITGAISIGLQGQLQKQGALQVGGIGSAAAGQASFQITQQEQQSLTVPVTFVTIQGLPDFYMGQNLANLSNLPQGDPRAKLTTTILARRQHLSDLIANLIAAYPGACSAKSAPPPPIAPFLQDEQKRLVPSDLE